VVFAGSSPPARVAVKTKRKAKGTATRDTIPVFIGFASFGQNRAIFVESANEFNWGFGPIFIFHGNGAVFSSAVRNLSQLALGGKHGEFRGSDEGEGPPSCSP